MSPLTVCLGKLTGLYWQRVKIFGFGLGENFQNLSQVARGVPDHLCASALEALGRRAIWRSGISRAS